jgi:hypothetical protein
MGRQRAGRNLLLYPNAWSSRYSPMSLLCPTNSCGTFGAERALGSWEQTALEHLVGNGRAAILSMMAWRACESLRRKSMANFSFSDSGSSLCALICPQVSVVYFWITLSRCSPEASLAHGRPTRRRQESMKPALLHGLGSSRHAPGCLRWSGTSKKTSLRRCRRSAVPRIATNCAVWPDRATIVD